MKNLTHRAENFLASEGTRIDLDYDRATDRADGIRARDLFGTNEAEFHRTLESLRSKFSGIRYLSRSWSFEEEITYVIDPDLEESDSGPMFSIIEHSVAHPFGVWADLTGAVYFMFPQDTGAEYVPVFDSVEALVESDALHFECSNLLCVASGGSDSIAAISNFSQFTARIGEASGPTESWWQGEGFKVFKWATWKVLFANDKLERWAVYAETANGEEAALSILMQ